MKTIGNVQKDGQVRAVASGALTDGTPVIVNADGTVSVVGIGAASIGTEVQFEAGNVNYLCATYDTLNDKVIIAYQDNGNSNYGTAIVGTVSGSSISFGTAVVFKSATIEYPDITFDSNSNKVVIAYRLSPGGDHGKAIVGTVSGTSISFGSEVTYNSGTTDNISCDFDSTHNRVVVAFRDVGAGSPFPGKAIVGSVSGTSISFGQEVRFKNANITDTTVSFDSSSEKIVIAYRDNTNSNQGIAIVGDVEPSNNSISFGSEVVFETTATQYTRAVYDSGNNKTNIFYMDGGDSDKGKAVIGTVSGTSISFTSPSNFYTDAGINALTAVYDSNAAKSVIGIRGASAYGYAIPITSDGSSFTVGSSTIITTNAYGGAGANPSVFDPDQKKVVFAYEDSDDSDKGKARVYSPAATTLTSENFIGFSDGAFATTQSAVINTANTIDRNQTSLTAGQTYFVTTAGALSTTAGDPSVKAGTAISSTELIVKG